MTHHSRCAGPLDLWTSGPLDLWTSGPLDLWTAGPLDRWTAGPLDRWTAGPLDRWTDFTPSVFLSGYERHVFNILFIDYQVSPPSIHAPHPWEIFSQLHQLRIRIVHGFHGCFWAKPKRLTHPKAGVAFSVKLSSPFLPIQAWPGGKHKFRGVLVRWCGGGPIEDKAHVPSPAPTRARLTVEAVKTSLPRCRGTF